MLQPAEARSEGVESSPLLGRLSASDAFLSETRRSSRSRLSGSHSTHFMFLVELPFRGAFQLSLAVLVRYRYPTEYLALDRQHDPYSASTIKLAYSRSAPVPQVP